MALPKVNPDRASEEGRIIDSQTDNRQRLQKSMREGQLNIVHSVEDLKIELQGMAKSLHTMVKMDRDALKRMKEQAGFDLERQREENRKLKAE